MSQRSLHGSGFSAVTIDQCVTAETYSREEFQFLLHGVEGALLGEELVGRAEGRTITIEKVPAISLERTSGEGLKFYCRIAPSEKAEVQTAEADLTRLADLLMAAGPAPRAERAATDINSAYTYLGQFIAHELSDLKVLDGKAVTIRSAALDLDSLFDAVPDDPLPTQKQIWKGGVGIGQARSFGSDVMYDDLPRRSDGTALIRDSRNDTNLALAQLHLALSKFHQFVAQHEDCRNAEDARRITRRHVQSVVLHDYLRRVCDPETYCDILQHGRRVIHCGGLPTNSPFLIPIEFAAACFRVGHSMVRNVYTEWEFGSQPVELRSLLALTGQDDGFHQLRHLSAEWRINWASMLDGAPGPATSVNMAERIDARLADELFRLPNRFFSASMPGSQDAGVGNLARATLLRQRAFGLRSGQRTVDAVNALAGGGLAVPILDPQAVIAAMTQDQANGNPLAQFLDATGMHENTPLWLYCLAESRSYCGGGCFGPLTSRVVMETIHAAIEAAPDGIVANDGRTITFSTGESLNGKAEFHLPDLIAIALSYPHPTPA
jgi:hypothetical protein